MTLTELIAALRQGRATPDMQRRAAELLARLRPAKRGRPRNDPYAWRDRFEQVETEKATKGTVKAAYVAVAAQRSVKWTSVKRQHMADKRENEAFEKFVDEAFDSLNLEGDKK
jgi:hypothetical protein